MNWLSSIQLTNISALFLGILAPLLALAYLRQKKLSKKIVSSVLILKTLSQSTTFKRKFKPPLRFFLELLALLLLILAAATPLYRTQVRRIAVVIDNSLSMRARIGSSMDSPTRFEKTISRAQDWLKNQDSNDLFAVFASSPTFTRMGERSISASQAINQLSNIVPTFTSDTLNSSVHDLGETGKFDVILLISDKNIAQVDFDSTAKKHNLTTIRSLTVGTQLPNTFVSGIKLKSTRTKTKIIASIGLSNSKPIETQITLSKLKRNSEAKDENFVLAHSSTVKLSPSKSTDVVFDVDNSRNNNGIYKVTINTPSELNSIKEDDSAWIGSNATLKSSILLVSPTKDFSGLKSIANFDVTSVTPTEFQSYDAKILEQYALLIFHLSSPATPPPVSTLLILPPEQNPLFPVKTAARKPNLTSWNDTNPLTSYLRIPLLTPQSALVFSTPAWASPVISVEQGPILVAGESRGRRFAALGIEVLPFEGAKTPTQSILTLNLIRWLTGRAKLEIGTLAGSSIKLQANRSWVILDPNGEITSIETKEDSPGSYIPNVPGVYTLTSITGADSSSLKQQTQIITVNTFFPTESQTFDKVNLEFPNQISHKITSLQSQLPIWPSIVSLVLLVLLIEFCLRTFITNGEKAQLTT